MFRWVYRFGRPAAVLGLALLLLQGAEAQPGGKGKGKQRGDDPAPMEDAKASPELQTWIKTLTDKMTDRQDSIRDSARAALVSIGRPALPELQKLADGRDSASSEAAKQVIARIERGGRTGGFGPGGGFPGGGGGGGTRPGGGGAGGGGNAPTTPSGFGTVDRALKDLDLSEKQKTKLEDIKAAQVKKFTDLTEKARDGKIDVEELQKAFAKNRDEMIKDIEAVLTRDQIDQFEKALKDAPPPNPGTRPGGGRGPGNPGGGGPGGGGRGGPGGGGPGGFGGGFGFAPSRALTQALKNLDLSEKQQAKVEKIMAAQQDKVRDLMEKARDGSANPQEIRAAVEKMQDDLVKDIKDVLTKDQADQLDKALKDAQRGGGRGGSGGGPGGRGGPGRQIE